MNRDQFEGRADEMAGGVKEVIGKLVGDKELELNGSVQASVGQAQEEKGDLIQDASDSVA